MGGCQNYGPFLGTLNIRGRIIMGIQLKDNNFDTHPCEGISQGYSIASRKTNNQRTHAEKHVLGFGV